MLILNVHFLACFLTTLSPSQCLIVNAVTFGQMPIGQVTFGLNTHLMISYWSKVSSLNTVCAHSWLNVISIIMTYRHDEIWFLNNVFHLTNLATTTI